MPVIMVIIIFYIQKAMVFGGFHGGICPFRPRKHETPLTEDPERGFIGCYYVYFGLILYRASCKVPRDEIQDYQGVPPPWAGGSFAGDSEDSCM